MTEPCFPEVGRCADARFASYWAVRGGLARHGYPLGDPLVETLEDGRPHVVQYYERSRLEWHPGNDPPYDVLLGQFGRRVLAGVPGAPVAPTPPRNGYTHVAQTGHNVRPAFWAYWEANGGLAQFGHPLSEEFAERLEDGHVYTVQYFERARLEWHPEHAPDQRVQLGQFGRRILAEGTP